jgi:hypothetical protein
MDTDMNFATHYFTRYKTLLPFFHDKPEDGLEIVVIIPCLDDDFIFRTLDSLESAKAIQRKTEVIVHVNSGEKTPLETVEKNRRIFDGLARKAASGFYNGFYFSNK